ncbi:hypothetical protein ACLOJK_021286 [Asimina triloba]
MSGFQRSSVSFRRQGSSGLVWEDRFLSGDLNEMKKRTELEEQGGDKMRGLRACKSVSSAAAAGGSGTRPSASGTKSNTLASGGSAWRASKVSPTIDPPSPKLQGCALCGFFAGSNTTELTKPRKKR